MLGDGCFWYLVTIKEIKEKNAREQVRREKEEARRLAISEYKATLPPNPPPIPPKPKRAP